MVMSHLVMLGAAEGFQVNTKIKFSTKLTFEMCFQIFD